MDKNKLVSFILRDLEELDTLTRGMESLSEVPQVVHTLAIDKVKNLLWQYEQLAVCNAQSAEPHTHQTEEIARVAEEVLTKSEHKEWVKPEPIVEVKAEQKIEQSTPVSPKAHPSDISTTNEKFKTQLRDFGVSAKRSERRFVTDLKKSISLADRYRYQRELFAGDMELLYKTVDYLNSLSSVDEAYAYIKENFDWDLSTGAAADFATLLENRYSD